MFPTLVFLTNFEGSALDSVLEPFKGKASICVIRSLEDLEKISFSETTVLLVFGSGVVVPSRILEKMRLPAYNVHAASPEFPGRDPHHHAIYRKAKRYGATLHQIIEKIDAGPIVSVEWFDVEDDDTPTTLLDKSNQAGIVLIKRYADLILSNKTLVSDEKWGTIKTKRSDLKKLCHISPLIDEASFKHLKKSFDSENHRNLTVSIHEVNFIMDVEIKNDEKPTDAFDDFTEKKFIELIELLKAEKYKFSCFDEDITDKHVLWRHDIDISLHRAVSLAKIESAFGVAATYFINPHSIYYNIFEPRSQEIINQILSLGHQVGLHFDTQAFPNINWDYSALAEAIEREKILLSYLIPVDQIKAVSWHNPDSAGLLSFDFKKISGLVNAYSKEIRDKYTYCSDSNGYWRHQSMFKTINDGHRYLHLLTHPEWWVPNAQSPSKRIDRAILGRAQKCRKEYDDGINLHGRVNLS